MGRELNLIPTFTRFGSRLSRFSSFDSLTTRAPPTVDRLPAPPPPPHDALVALYVTGVSRTHARVLRADVRAAANQRYRTFGPAAVSTALFDDVVELLIPRSLAPAVRDALTADGYKTCTRYDPLAAATGMPEPARSRCLAELLRKRQAGALDARVPGLARAWYRRRLQMMAPVVPYLIRAARVVWTARGDVGSDDDEEAEQADDGDDAGGGESPPPSSRLLLTSVATGDGSEQEDGGENDGDVCEWLGKQGSLRCERNDARAARDVLLRNIYEALRS